MRTSSLAPKAWQSSPFRRPEDLSVRYSAVIPLEASAPTEHDSDPRERDLLTSSSSHRKLSETGMSWDFPAA